MCSWLLINEFAKWNRCRCQHVDFTVEIAIQKSDPERKK